MTTDDGADLYLLYHHVLRLETSAKFLAEFTNEFRIYTETEYVISMPYAAIIWIIWISFIHRLIRFVTNDYNKLISATAASDAETDLEDLADAIINNLAMLSAAYPEQVICTA